MSPYTDNHERVRYRLVFFSLLPIMLPSVYLGFRPGKIAVIEGACMLLYVFFVFLMRKELNFRQVDKRAVICCYLFYMVFMYIRGYDNIYSWQDYAFLYTGFFNLVIYPYWILIAKPKYIYVMFRALMTWGVIGSIVLFFFPGGGMHGMQDNTLWLSAFVFLFPYIKRKYVLIILLGCLIVVLYKVTRRGILLSFAIPFAILWGYKLCKGLLFSRPFFYVMAIVPVLALCLFVTDTFNVFQYVSSENSEVTLRVGNSSRRLFVDSRTSICEDVARDVLRARPWYKPLIGLGGNGRVRVLANGESSAHMQGWRTAQESGMLNYIQWGGILGMVTFGALTLTGAYLAMFRSRNRFIRMLGLLVLYRYVFSFVEDRQLFTVHTYICFVWLGMCYNRAFRMMTDTRIKAYFRRGLKITPIIKTLAGKSKPMSEIQ